MEHELSLEEESRLIEHMMKQNIAVSYEKVYRAVSYTHLFMALSFLVRMGEATGDAKYFDDAANQILNYTRYLWCPEKGLYYHCYHTDNKAPVSYTHLDVYKRQVYFRTETESKLRVGW